MKSLRWDRTEIIERLRKDIWRFITQASTHEEQILLSAAALLQMKPPEVRFLAQLQFILSEPVGRLLAEMQTLMRRLANTTITETERSAQRVRGAIRWGETYAQRAASGQPNLFVTAPARRAFNTPENEVLVFALFAVAEFGKRTGWYRSNIEGPAAEIHRRVAEATKWMQSRELAGIVPSPPSAMTVGRVRSGRNRRRYENALKVVELYSKYIAQLDRAAIREAIENRALITRSDDVLLELLCAFEVIKTLRGLGWTSGADSLVGPDVGRPLLFDGERNGENLKLYYQNVPPKLSYGSIYNAVQRAHNFPHLGPLRPDLVVRIQKGEAIRWLIVEVKGGPRREVSQSARRATLDLFGYRRAFAPVLDLQKEPYGLGYAWGSGLSPSKDSDVTLCTPDTMSKAIELLLGSAPSV